MTMIGMEHQLSGEASEQDLVSFLTQEYEQVQKERSELEVLLQQSSGEVEKLAQRNAQLVNQVRTMEHNFDTVPCEDIKSTYKTSQEVQMRLFMMRGQVEQLNSKQDQLQRYEATLQQVLDASGSLPTGADGDEADASSTGGLTVAEDSMGIVKIIDAQESERRSLANQLHDGPAQALTNLILQAEICERLFDSDPTRARTELTVLKDSVKQTFQKVRGFIFDLRPMMLDDLGLSPTLKKFTDDWQGQHSIPCQFRIMGQDRRLPAHAEVTIFRVTQHLLKNITDHANASSVKIGLDFGNEKISTYVEDDGAGFDVDTALTSARERNTIGFGTIPERIELLGGDIKIESNPGRGTRIEFVIPVAE